MKLSVEGLDLRQADLLASSVATLVFIASYLPMLVKAARTREMSSYRTTASRSAPEGRAHDPS